MPYEPLDPQGIRTYPLASRPSKVRVESAATAWKPGGSFREFLASLPKHLAAGQLLEVAREVVQARQRGKPVILGMGAHVIKVGLTPILVDLIQHQMISAVALNGAGVIHDFELALAGFTSEDVESQLAQGEFGMAEETGRILNEAVTAGVRQGLGFGRSVGVRLLEMRPPYLAHSLVAACAQAEIPCTVHVAVGTDIVHMHPCCNGAVIGEASLLDFRLLAAVVAELGDGGVYLNVGSAVLLPEVFLKALTLARNLGHQVQDFVTVNMDFIQHYRPTQNVVRRPVARGGTGYALTGHHELLVPLLAAAIIEERESRAWSREPRTERRAPGA